jgi:hypothetical protein
MAKPVDPTELVTTVASLVKRYMGESRGE